MSKSIEAFERLYDEIKTDNGMLKREIVIDYCNVKQDLEQSSKIEEILNEIDLGDAQHTLNTFVEDENNDYESTGFFCIMFQRLIDAIKEIKIEKEGELIMENKTLKVDRTIYESKGEVFEIKTEQELVSVYIHDDGWLHFKMSFHKKFIDELIKKLEDIK